MIRCYTVNLSLSSGESFSGNRWETSPSWLTFLSAHGWTPPHSGWADMEVVWGVKLTYSWTLLSSASWSKSKTTPQKSSFLLQTSKEIRGWIGCKPGFPWQLERKWKLMMSTNNCWLTTFTHHGRLINKYLSSSCLLTGDFLAYWTSNYSLISFALLIGEDSKG
jgi:hypothetical protein